MKKSRGVKGQTGKRKKAKAASAIKQSTGLKLAEEKLRKSEERNRYISEVISDYAYSFRIELDGTMHGEWLSESFTRVFGFTLEEISARGGWQSIVHLEDLSTAIEHARKAVTGQKDICEFRFVTKNGEARWIRDYAVPIWDEAQGRVTIIYGASQDITEHKHSEQALHENEERFRTLTETTATAIFVYSNEYFVYVNRAALELIGYSAEEFLSLHFWDVIHPDHKELVHQRGLARLRGEHIPSRYEFKIICKNGTERWIDFTSGKIQWQGNTLAIGSAFDITERKRAEEEKKKLEDQLFQAQKMEAIGRLAGGVAHDFNNMLNVIIGYGEIILGKLAPDDPVRKDVEEIINAGSRSAALTRQLLAFSRKQIIEPAVLDVNVLLKNLEKILRRLITENINMVLALSEDLGRVKADPSQVEQVIMNLAINAKDAMPRGGKLTIETANANIDDLYARNHTEVVPGRYVMIAVSDTGYGMDKETRSKIFEPFFTTKDKGKGTGLGLAMVYGIVKQSGGHIFVYSEPGQGTTFKIYLLRTEDKPDLKEARPAEQEHRGGNEHILVVEDEAKMRRLFEAVLPSLGYRVTTAANGDEALRLVDEKEVEPDLVITDVVMPGMSGTVLVERLRKNKPDLKVLFMSGYTDNAIVHHGVLDPGTPFIQKPFHIKALTAKIEEVMRGIK